MYFHYSFILFSCSYCYCTELYLHWMSWNNRDRKKVWKSAWSVNWYLFHTCNFSSPFNWIHLTSHAFNIPNNELMNWSWRKVWRKLNLKFMFCVLDIWETSGSVRACLPHLIASITLSGYTMHERPLYSDLHIW